MPAFPFDNPTRQIFETSEEFVVSPFGSKSADRSQFRTVICFNAKMFSDVSSSFSSNRNFGIPNDENPNVIRKNDSAMRDIELDFPLKGSFSFDRMEAPMESVIFKFFGAIFRLIGFLLITGFMVNALTDLQRQAFIAKRHGLVSLLQINQQLVGRTKWLK